MLSYAKIAKTKSQKTKKVASTHCTATKMVYDFERFELSNTKKEKNKIWYRIIFTCENLSIKIFTSCCLMQK